MKKLLVIIAVVVVIISIYYFLQPTTYKETTVDGMTFSLGINQEAYSLEDDLIITASVKNTTDETKYFTAQTACDVGPRLGIRHGVEFYFQDVHNELESCYHDRIEYSVEPGEVLSKTMTLEGRRYAVDPVLYTHDRKPTVYARFNDTEMTLPLTLELEKRQGSRFDVEKLFNEVRTNEDIQGWFGEKGYGMDWGEPRYDALNVLSRQGDYLVLEYPLPVPYTYLAFLFNPDERVLLEAMLVDNETDKREIIYQTGPPQQLALELSEQPTEKFIAGFEQKDGIALEDILAEFTATYMLTNVHSNIVYVKVTGEEFLRMFADDRLLRLYRYYDANKFTPGPY